MMMCKVLQAFIPLPGYESYYEINQIGNVRSVARKGTKGRILKEIKEEYIRVGICVDKKVRFKRIHKLLALAFIPNPHNYSQINHIDGNKYNNSLSNLEWCNNSQNQKHAYDNGLSEPRRGSKNGMSILSEKEVKEIREYYEQHKPKYGRKQLAEQYGVSPCTIKDIVTRRKNCWPHV